jgi:muramoyltetrapeptide carboxypeptidase
MPTRSRTAALWCPAYPLADAQALARARAGAAALAGRCGWTVVEAPLLGRHLGPGAWLPAEQRGAELAALFVRDVLIAGRGGYGCLDLLAALPARCDRPPLLIGYSDLTVLHAAWRVRGWGETLYGFMPGVAAGGRSLATTADLAQGRAVAHDQALIAEAAPVRPGRAAGPLVAGCLRVLAGLVGTPWMPDLAGTILALEDIDERPYRVARDLRQLELAGCLAGVRGLATNAFPAEAPAGYAGPSAAEVVGALAGRLGIPALVGLPFGHHPDPLTLACGRETLLECGAAGWRLEQQPRG